jgi:hypothetical protein
MASIGKTTFNIDDQTIYLASNIPIQQTLRKFSILSLDSLNRFTCQYEQLQLVVI